MNRFQSIRPWLAAILVGVLGACGGGSRDPILGFDGTAPPITPPAATAPPTVTAVAPAVNATGVAVNNTVITAAFSEAVKPLTGTASFVETCAAPCVSPTGTVSLDSTNRIATFALSAGSTLST